MNRFFIRLAVVFFISSHAATMKYENVTLYDYSTVPQEIFSLILADLYPIKLEQLLALNSVCKTWQIIFTSEEFWKLFYGKKYGHYEKINVELGYKENFSMKVFRLCHMADNSSLSMNPSPFDMTTTSTIELISADPVLPQNVRESITDEMLKKSHVLCSCFGFYTGGSTVDDHITSILDCALTHDVLVILPAGGHGANLSRYATGKNIHETYPNVMWISSLDQEKNLSWSNNSDLVDVALLNNERYSSAAVLFSNLAIYLRGLRPGLSAKKIREIIIATADTVDKNTGKPYPIALVNGDAAIKAVKNFSINVDK